MEDVIIVAMFNLQILSDTDHEKYELPHVRDAAWLTVCHETGVERKKMGGVPLILYFAMFSSRLAFLCTSIASRVTVPEKRKVSWCVS